jgi:hypothetical protein
LIALLISELTRSSVYQYVSQLENGHPRFPRKEDLLWYLMFICTTILVCCSPRDPWLHPSPSPDLRRTPQISARVVLVLPTIAVPGIEEDYPCASAGSSFAYLKEGQLAAWAWWDVSMDDSCNYSLFVRVVILLPTSSQTVLCLDQCFVCWTGTDFVQILSQFIGTHFTFLQGLILACVYTATQDSRGMKAQFFFFTVPAQLVPYCMMLVTFLMSGPNAFLLQLNGLLAAHLWDFLTRILPEFGGFPNILQTPGFLSRLVETPRVVERSYGTAIRGQGNQASGRTTGASTGGGVLPDSWRTRGAGQRLGAS